MSASFDIFGLGVFCDTLMFDQYELYHNIIFQIQTVKMSLVLGCLRTANGRRDNYRLTMSAHARATLYDPEVIFTEFKIKD